MTVDILAPRDVQTTLNYFVPKSPEPPYAYAWDPPAGVPKTNITNEPFPVVVHDARAAPPSARLGLDVSGFTWATHPSAEKAFDDDARVRAAYYPEVEAILKAHGHGAKRVFIFDHTIRRGKEEEVGQGRNKAPVARAPAHVVHIDQTFEAAEWRVRHHLPDEAERLLKGRYRIINVWRPIKNPVAHDPLGVADYRSVDVDADVVASRLIYPDREGGTFRVKHNPGHKWYYLSDQTPDEVTLIKCFDSDTDKARFTPHSAFPDNTSPADAPQRQSIEVRALVFDTE